MAQILCHFAQCACVRPKNRIQQVCGMCCFAVLAHNDNADNAVAAAGVHAQDHCGRTLPVSRLHDPPVVFIRRHARPRQNRGSGCPPLD